MIMEPIYTLHVSCRKESFLIAAYTSACVFRSIESARKMVANSAKASGMALVSRTEERQYGNKRVIYKYRSGQAEMTTFEIEEALVIE
jgi:hypothetical protein